MIELISPYGKDFPMLHVQTKACSGLVSLYGAQVLGWTPPTADPVLWLSPQCTFQRGKAIRGGIPICWPWFGKSTLKDDAPSHGTARISVWQIERAQEANDGLAEIELLHEPFLPSLPTARLTISMGESLHLKLETCTQKASPFSAAFHTYFNVGDYERCFIEGLADVPFNEYATDGTMHDESPLSPKGSIDRIYHPVDGNIILHDPILNRRIAMLRKGSRSAVVWNPGTKQASAMDDVGIGNERHFLCLEAAVAPCEKVQLMQNEPHIFECEISIMPETEQRSASK